jgi:hypothetical protein
MEACPRPFITYMLHCPVSPSSAVHLQRALLSCCPLLPIATSLSNGLLAVV